MAAFLLGAVVAMLVNVITLLFKPKTALKLVPSLTLYIVLHGLYFGLQTEAATAMAVKIAQRFPAWWTYLIVIGLFSAIGISFWIGINAAVAKLEARSRAEAPSAPDTDSAKKQLPEGKNSDLSKPSAQPKPQPSRRAIVIEGSTSLQVEGNFAEGFDEGISISGSTGVRAKDNIAISSGAVGRAPATRDEAKLSRYGRMTNQELQSETLTFAARLRAFNDQQKLEARRASEQLWQERMNAPKDKQQELSQKEQAVDTEKRARLTSGYNQGFRGEALALCDELRRRLPTLAKSLGSGAKRPILLDYGSFAGPDAVGDAADYLDRLARALPVK